MEWLKLLVPLVAAAVAWLVNEWQKRKWEQYQRREASYRELLLALRGFYPEAVDRGASYEAFVSQLTLAWLYCPDDVIQRGYDFLDSINSKPDPKANPMGDFVAAIRRDLLSHERVNSTKLTGDEFRHYAVKR